MRKCLKYLAKQTLYRLLQSLVMPFVLGYRCQAFFLGENTALENWSELLGKVPGIIGNYARRAFLGFVVQECHSTASIGYGTLFTHASVRIASGVYVGPRCHIAMATLEEDCLISPGVHVTSGPHTHGINEPGMLISKQPGDLRQVVIGSGAWIGSCAVIMADVGGLSVVGAGAVVAKPLPSRVVAVGVPARVIRRR